MPPTASERSNRHGPGAKLWQSLRGKKSQKRSRGAPVGTQAKALEQLQHNKEHFSYPPQGFATQIEHSLIYNMISEPKIYPEEVVLKHIADEDFSLYLAVNGNDDEDEDLISYKQLSALLALSAEKFPPPQESFTSSALDDQPSIPRQLCKTVLRFVVKYAQEQNLDRKDEVEELLGPVERYMAKRTESSILPLYLAYAAGILIPGGIGIGITMLSLSAILASSDQVDKENKNVHTMARETDRVADVERTGLLDEAEEF